MSAAMRFVRLALAAIGAVAIGDSAAAAESVSAGALPRHLGVASCAASACHGKIAPLTNLNVALNEYRTWLLSDRHSQAFRILQSAKSGAIAGKLGIAEASAAKVCLDCHADNVPTELRGAKFLLSDGVGCESCHGGAQGWIGTHSKHGALHAENVARGMVPLERAQVRADVCLACHAGDGERFVTHTLIAAGHPRLRFELENYTANMPPHHWVDADYRQRKRAPDGINLWLVGQLRNARTHVQLLQGEWMVTGRMQPELAFYECYACHRPVDELRWTRKRAGAEVQPGSLRLQHQSLAVLTVVTGVIEAQALPELQEAIAEYARSGSRDVGAAKQAAARLGNWLDGRSSWETRHFGATEAREIRRLLVRFAADDQASDYTVAEQVVLSIESLSATLGDGQPLGSALDALYAEVRTPTAFEPTRFARTAGSVEGRF
ncbi:MAG TPA: multiheme c-type cytochrome [Steroidobacteraceae bacterium]|nr:multiheme c-type cytochrome [Steroidobacteraceae bacterium]